MILIQTRFDNENPNYFSLSIFQIKIHFKSDDYEHGRGAVINWRAYSRNEILMNKTADGLKELFIDFEEGWICGENYFKKNYLFS